MSSIAPSTVCGESISSFPSSTKSSLSDSRQFGRNKKNAWPQQDLPARGEEDILVVFNGKAFVVFDTTTCCGPFKKKPKISDNVKTWEALYRIIVKMRGLEFWQNAIQDKILGTPSKKTPLRIGVYQRLITHMNEQPISHPPSEPLEKKAENLEDEEGHLPNEISPEPSVSSYAPSADGLITPNTTNQAIQAISPKCLSKSLEKKAENLEGEQFNLSNEVSPDPSVSSCALSSYEVVTPNTTDRSVQSSLPKYHLNFESIANPISDSLDSYESESSITPDNGECGRKDSPYVFNKYSLNPTHLEEVKQKESEDH